ncbi:unnamed protein product [Meloidogyne enterolobii]|uniref:Uncharacterized protein n=1 Tax=Meloidogyne enterolobii TaxID=390850 RepID=A0ACB0YZ50_MELEN
MELWKYFRRIYYLFKRRFILRTTKKLILIPILILMFINAPPYNVEIKLSEKKEKEKQIFKFLKLNNKSRIYWHQWLEPLNFRKKIPEFDRFILTEYMDGQLGNQVC